MDFNATIDLIIKDLNEAREIIDDLKKYPGVPVLQVELAKSKCRSAGEIISLLKSLKEDHTPGKPEKEEPTVTEKKEEKPSPVTATAKEPLKEQTGPAGVEANEYTEVKTSEPEVAHDEDNSKAEPSTGDQGSAIIADRYSNLSPRINEQMGTGKGEDDISGLIKSQPISDLSDAIGINDRFMFIREIFGGDREAYEKAIGKLNNASSINDARAVIMSFTTQNANKDAVSQLTDLVKRKLNHNE